MSLDPESEPRGSEERLLTIRHVGDQLMQSGESGTGLYNGPDWYASSYTFVLPGEALGEMGTFFMLECYKSSEGNSFALGQYFEHSDTVKLPEDLRELPRYKAPQAGPFIAVHFVDIETNVTSPIHEVETNATPEQTESLVQVMQNPDLVSFVVGDLDVHHSEAFIYHNHRTFNSRQQSISALLDSKPELLTRLSVQKVMQLLFEENLPEPEVARIDTTRTSRVGATILRALDKLRQIR